MSRPVHVIGAGFSGLLTAHFLLKKNIKATVFEAAAGPGGLISSQRNSFGLVETAANGFMNSILSEQVFSDLNLKIWPARPESRRRYFVRNGIRQWPLSILETLGFAIKALLAFVTGSFPPRKFESVKTWGDRVFGKAFNTYFFSTALQGVYAGDPAFMSAKLMYERLKFLLKNRKKPKPSVPGLVTAIDGMGGFLKTLASNLQSHGVEIHYSQRRSEIDPQALTCLCIPGPEAGRLLQDSNPEIARGLLSIDLVPVVSATLFFPREDTAINGFGCLFSADVSSGCLGVLFNHCIFEERGPQSSETWILGGAGKRKVINLSDQEILEVIKKDRALIYPKQDFSKVLSFTITRWPKAIPHYDMNLEKFLEQPLNLPENILIVGNFLGGIGLSQIIQNAKNAADRIAEMVAS